MKQLFKIKITCTRQLKEQQNDIMNYKRNPYISRTKMEGGEINKVKGGTDLHLFQDSEIEAPTSRFLSGHKLKTPKTSRKRRKKWIKKKKQCSGNLIFRFSLLDFPTLKTIFLKYFFHRCFYLFSHTFTGFTLPIFWAFFSFGFALTFTVFLDTAFFFLF